MVLISAVQQSDSVLYIYVYICVCIYKYSFSYSFFFFLAVRHGTWDLSSLTRDRTHVPCIGRRILNHWTTREFLHILFHYGLSWDIEYSSLCYTVGPCYLPILYTSLHLLIPNSQSFPPPPPLGNHRSVLYACESVSIL